jgi:uncharacterized protein YhfF
MSDSCIALWNEFLASEEPAAASARGATYAAWQFGYGVEQGDRLLEVVLTGPKRATAGALAAYEQEDDAVPRPGDFSIVTDGSGVARCVIRTTQVDITPFDQVDERFAHDEGEGDRSLEYWRSAHWRFFVRELESFGLVATPDMPVVCERFEVVFPPLSGTHA